MQKKIIAKKMIKSILALFCFLHFKQAQAVVFNIKENDLQVLMKNSKVIKNYAQCGEYRTLKLNKLPASYILPRLEPDERIVFSYPGKMVTVPTEKKLTAKSPEAKLFILENGAALTKKTFMHEISKEFYRGITPITNEFFLSEVAPLHETSSSEITQYIAQTQNLLFANNIKNFRDKILLHLAIYPQVADIVIHSHTHLRPMLCHLQHKKIIHDKRMRISGAIAVLAVATGIPAMILSGYGIILLPLAFIAGASGMTAGLRDIIVGVKRFKRVEATAKVATAILDLSKKTKNYEEILGIESLTLSKNRVKELTRLNRKKHINRGKIAIGAIFIGLNAINFIPIGH